MLIDKKAIRNSFKYKDILRKTEKTLFSFGMNKIIQTKALKENINDINNISI